MKRKKNEIQGIRKGGNSLHGKRTGALVLTLALVLGIFATPEIPGVTNPAGVKVEAKSGKDKKKPTIKFSGKSQITVEKNEVIKIPKTTAKDNKDGNVTKKISVTVKKGKTSYKSIATKIKKNKKVKFSSAGKYTVTYSVKDKAGNKATKKRYITVVESKAENTTTEAPTSQTTEIPTTTEMPTTTETPTTTEQATTENQTTEELKVMPPVDLSQFGKIEQVTINGNTYNIAKELYEEPESIGSSANFRLDYSSTDDFRDIDDIMMAVGDNCKYKDYEHLILYFIDGINITYDGVNLNNNIVFRETAKGRYEVCVVFPNGKLMNTLGVLMTFFGNYEDVSRFVESTYVFTKLDFQRDEENEITIVPSTNKETLSINEATAKKPLDYSKYDIQELEFNGNKYKITRDINFIIDSGGPNVPTESDEIKIEIENDYVHFKMDIDDEEVYNANMLKYLGKVTAKDKAGNDISDRILFNVSGLTRDRIGTTRGSIVSIFVQDMEGNSLDKTFQISLYDFDESDESYGGGGYKLINENPRVYARLKESN